MRLKGLLARLLYWTASSSVQALPIGAAYWIAERIADFVYVAVWRQRRRIVISNMRHVLGPKASRRKVSEAARRSVRNYAKYIVEFLRFPIQTMEELSDLIVFDHWDRMDEMLASKRGAMFVGLHMGNWDAAGSVAGLRGYPFNVIVETLVPKELDDYIQSTRGLKGMRTLSLEQGARGLMKALRKGEFVGLLIDRPTPGTGVSVRFFDAMVNVPAGAATLALKTGAKVVPTGLMRLPDDRFEFIIDDELEYTPIGDRDVDIQQITQAIFSSLEKVVRRYPEQWYMFRRMWPEDSVVNSRAGNTSSNRRLPLAVGND